MSVLMKSIRVSVKTSKQKKDPLTYVWGKGNQIWFDMEYDTFTYTNNNYNNNSFKTTDQLELLEYLKGH